MELGVRDWIIIVGALVVFAIALEVFRSIRGHQRDNIRMSARKAARDSDAGDDLNNPELPSGGARVVSVREPARPSTQSRLNVEQDVPVLMDAVIEDEAGSTSVAADPDLDPVAADEPEPEIIDSPPVAEEPVVEVQVEEEAPEPAPQPKKPKKQQNEPAPANEAPAYQELIVLNVMGAEGKPIKGADLLQILLACDVRYGKQQIFRRFENSDGSGAEQFGVANLVEPGTFDLDNIESFETPGVVFFMHLPGPQKPLEAFDCMAETAKCLVNNLGCEMLDEAHSVATTQTIEHLRQRIRDFERKQLTLV